MRQWGHMTEREVTEEDYGRRYSAQQVPHEYVEHVREEMPECKFYQSVNVSKLNV